MGYFSLFDFGLGRATTKFVAEYYARNMTENLPALIWSSVVVHTGLGFLGGGLLALLTPLLAENVLTLPPNLLNETRTVFYLLAASVPLIVVTAALRGVLEAIQRFDMVNAIRIPASVINYLGPLPVLYFEHSLTAVVAFLVASRVVVLFAHLLLCLRALPDLSREFRFDASLIKPMIGFGGWLTLTNVLSSSIVSLDRFMIGAIVSISAVAYYATPYEIVTKLWIFSAGLLAVLFPAFSSMAVNQEHKLRLLYGQALKYLLVVVAPIVGVLLALAFDLLRLWIGEDFAQYSAPAARWLTIGVLINVLAQVPITVTQGMGRADVAAKLQLVQLPLYALLVWYLAGILGFVGVAIAWTIRAAAEAAFMAIAANRLLPEAGPEQGKIFSLPKIVVVALFLLAFLWTGLYLSNDLLMEIPAVCVLLGVFVFWEWRFLLTGAERERFTGEVRSILKRAR